MEKPEFYLKQVVKEFYPNEIGPINIDGLHTKDIVLEAMNRYGLAWVEDYSNTVEHHIECLKELISLKP